MPPSPFALFERKALSQPELTFLIAPAAAELPYAPAGFHYSYGEAHSLAKALADQLRQAGYGAGSRVALLLQNRPAFFFHWLALNSIGASIVPINHEMRADELRHQLVVSDAGLIITLDEFMPLVEAARPATCRVVCLGQAFPAARPTSLASRPAAETECALLFTSGSTGKPKACVLSNGYFTNMAQWYVTQGGVAEMAEDREVALTPLPFFHMNALGCTAVGMMAIGGAIVPIDRFHARRWWGTVVASGATIVHNLGVIPAILLQLPVSHNETRHRVKFNLSPGVDAGHKTAFEDRFRMPIVEGWAMTETGGAAVTSTAAVQAPPGTRCIGAPRDGMEHRIVDDAGNDARVGQPGELLVRSAGDDPRAGFFSGYLGEPEATEAAWDGGWFHTGDIVSADPEGLLYFVDRKKSVIRRSGENISALEVEAVLMDDPEVAAVAVTAVSDPIRAEEVFAFVVPAGGSRNELDALACLTRAARRLSYHKLPGYIAYTPALPLGATNKLQRAVVRQHAEEALAAGSAFDLRDRKSQLRVAS